MRKLLLLLLLPVTTFAQDTLDIKPAGSVVSAGNKKLSLDLGVYATGKRFDDSTKALRTSITAANVTISSQGSAITLQGGSILSLQSSTNDLYAKHKQDSTAIVNIIIPPTAGIPKPITKTANFTVTDTCYNRDIWMNCSLCTVTFGTCTPGTVVFIHAPLGQVNFAGTLIEGTANHMSTNARPVRFIYKTSTQVQGK